MKRILRAVGVSVILVAAVAVGGFVTLASLDLNDYREEIAARIEAATGRDVTIEGELDLEISLDPALVVEGVSIANAAWGSRPAMVRLGRLEAKVELLPLLWGDVIVHYLLISGLDVLLETDALGRGNWVFAGADAGEAEATTGRPGLLPVVREVRLRDVTLAYRDGRSGRLASLSIDTLQADADGMDDPLRLRLAGTYNGAGFAATGRFGALSHLLGGGAPFPVTLRAKAFGADLAVEGSVAEPRQARGLDLRVTAKGDELAEAVRTAARAVPQLAGLALPPVGPYSVAARIGGSAEALSVSGLEIRVGRAEQVLIEVTGDIADAMAGAGIDLAVTVQGRDVTPFSTAAGTALPALPPFLVSARLGGQGGVYTVDDLALTLGGSDVKGRLTLRLDIPRPRLEATLASQVFDLADVAPGAAAPGEGAPTPPAGAGERVFSDQPLPVDGLGALDAVISVRAAAADIRLAAGRLEVKPLTATVAGGRIGAALSVDAGTGGMSLAIEARRLFIGRLLEDIGVAEVLDGRVDADVEVSGAGGSVRAIMAGLAGRTRLVVRDGRIDSEALGVASTGILDALPWIANADATRINCAVSRFDIEAGIAESRVLVLDTNGLTARGEGRIDLGEESIDMSIVWRAKQVSLASLSIPVRIGGTLAAPTLAPDVGRLASGLAAGAAGAAGGILEAPAELLGSLLGAKAGKATEAPAARGRATPGAAAAETPPPPQPDKGGVKGLLQGLGGSLGTILGGKKP